MARSKQQVLSAAGKWGLVYLVASLCIGAIIAVTPFMLAFKLDAEVGARSTEMSHLTKRLEEWASRSVASSQDKLDVAGVTIHADTVGIASAELQRHVASIADAAGLRISRIQPVNVNQSGNAVALQLELEAQGTVESVQNFLFALESGKPFTFVRDANIAVAANADPSVITGLPAVRMTLETTGWVGRI